jgi:hypothetical protein
LINSFIIKMLCGNVRDQKLERPGAKTRKSGIGNLFFQQIFYYRIDCCCYR